MPTASSAIILLVSESKMSGLVSMGSGLFLLLVLVSDDGSFKN